MVPDYFEISKNFILEPRVFSGHTSNIKKVLFAENFDKILSISDDKTLRVWETSSGAEVFCLKFTSTPNSIELSRDGSMLILAQGNCVELYETANFVKQHSFTIPSPVSAASIHPNKSVFVCGGENFTLYKYSIANGAELGW